MVKTSANSFWTQKDLLKFVLSEEESNITNDVTNIESLINVKTIKTNT